MSQSRDGMIAELKRIVIPALRELGFKGSFPHFHRDAEGHVELLTFQFSMAGGQFVIEIGKFPAAGYELYGKLIPAPEVKMRHLLRRLRLGLAPNKPPKLTWASPFGSTPIKKIKFVD